MTIERILVPVDYSPCSRAALQFAVELAERFQATLDIVHAWDKPSYVTEAVLMNKDPISGKSLIHMIQENAEHDLADFLSSANEKPGAVLQGRLVSGDPASALLHELKQGRHELVVVGTHGRTGLSRVLLGSVAEKLVRLSPVPVVTVPDDGAQNSRR
jgi:nucleotide-binding universal stress UspA family protein